MIDTEKWEKVVKGLQLCLNSDFTCSGDCEAYEDCPYSVQENGCISNIMADALELLKAQEPIMVKYTTSTIRCPKCNKQITSRGSIHNEIKYCWKCGQAVKWE